MRKKNTDLKQIDDKLPITSYIYIQLKYNHLRQLTKYNNTIYLLDLEKILGGVKYFNYIFKNALKKRHNIEWNIVLISFESVYCTVSLFDNVRRSLRKNLWKNKCIYQYRGFRVMVFNATINSISVIVNKSLKMHLKNGITLNGTSF
jgi:hypothetical protein